MQASKSGAFCVRKSIKRQMARTLRRHICTKPAALERGFARGVIIIRRANEPTPLQIQTENGICLDLRGDIIVSSPAEVK
jgi:hypothetical protein